MSSTAAPGKRIAIVYRDMAGLSGTPNTIFGHARYLADLGYRVDLVAEKIDRTRIEGERVNASRIRRLPALKRQRLSWFSRQADRRVRGHDFVAGHGHHGVQDVLSLHNCNHLCHEKIHGARMRRPDPATQLQDRILTGRRFALCIANSNLMRDELVDRYDLPPERIRVIYPGFDAERFHPAARDVHRNVTRRVLGIEPDECLIGVITSGAFRKRGLDLAIDAFAALPTARRARARMIVIGKDSRLDHYRAQIARKGLDRQIRILPPVRDIERYYHALDIYLHPARFEEFGQSVQEAMACGLPVATNRQVGATELLPPAAYAQVPRTSTVPVLVSQLERLIDDEGARREWVRHAREAVEGNCLQVNCERTLQVYMEAGLPPPLAETPSAPVRSDSSGTG